MQTLCLYSIIHLVLLNVSRNVSIAPDHMVAKSLMTYTDLYVTFM